MGRDSERRVQPRLGQTDAVDQFVAPELEAVPAPEGPYRLEEQNLKKGIEVSSSAVLWAYPPTKARRAGQCDADTQDSNLYRAAVPAGKRIQVEGLQPASRRACRGGDCQLVRAGPQVTHRDGPY